MRILTLLFSIFLLTQSTELVRLTEKNFVVLNGPVNSRSASTVINKLMEHRNDNTLYLYITTNGGSVVHGMELVNVIESLSQNGVNVVCIADIALSMGFVILQHCPVRYVTTSSVLMQHQMQVSTQGPLYNVISHVDFMKDMEKEIVTHESKRLGMDLDDYKQKVSNDWWLFGSSIVENGAADEIVNVLCDFDARERLEEFPTPFGMVNVYYSSCPLSRAPLRIEFTGNVSNAAFDHINQEFIKPFENPFRVATLQV